MTDLFNRIEQILGERPQQSQTLHGGDVARTVLLTMPDGTKFVVKKSDNYTTDFALEAWMLRILGGVKGIPVPEVVFADTDILVMAYIPHEQIPLPPNAEQHLAEILAHLHQVTSDSYGLDRATAVGPLPQVNLQNVSWVSFFRDRRLLAIAANAAEVGYLPKSDLERIHRLADRLTDFLEEPDCPALLHGDLWSGNVLHYRGKIAALIDPAIYYGHPEIELAFGTLFGPFGDIFFRHYSQLRPIRIGFFEHRRLIYLLWPLLVHLRLFGKTYLNQVRRVLRQLSF